MDISSGLQPNTFLAIFTVHPRPPRLKFCSYFCEAIIRYILNPLSDLTLKLPADNSPLSTVKGVRSPSLEGSYIGSRDICSVLGATIGIRGC